LNLGLSLVVHSKGGKNPITRAYASAVLSVAAWTFGQGMYFLADDRSSLFWLSFTFVAGSFIAFYFFHFARIFPNPDAISPMRFPAKQLIIIFPVLVSISLFFPQVLIRSINLSDSVTQVVFVNSSYIFYTTGFSLLMGWGFFHLLARYRESSGRQKMQIRYVIVGTGVATVFGSYFNLWLPWIGNTNFMWLGPQFSLFMIAFISYAIVKHRLMDIRLILNRAIVYSLLLGSTLVFYTMLILISQRFFQNKTGYVTSLVIGSLFIALGFEPLKQLFQKATERVFPRDSMDAPEVLTKMGETFSTFRDLNKLLTIAAQQLSNAFRTDHAIVVALMDPDDFLTVIGTSGDGPVPDINKDHPFIQYYSAVSSLPYQKIRLNSEILIQEDLREFPPLPALMDQITRANLISSMDRLEAAIIVPIFTKDQLRGLMLISPKRSGESFSPEDIKLLEIISQQAGVAIENARLYQTLQQQMEALKHSQTQQLIQSAKLASIGELATNVAHEINNPLTSILGFTTLILDDMEDNDPHKKDLKIIQSEAIRSRDIVRNLLDFARKRGTKKELVEINPLIQKILNLLRHQAEILNIVLREEYAPDLPTIIVDADQLKQVFVNLMKNAFDAMPNGGTLTVTTLAQGFSGKAPQSDFRPPETAFPNKMIELRFQDTGEGIAKEHLSKIFDPFFTTKEEVGTGLGLAVTYGIIERHGGRIEVFSEVGIGTTFVIKLPVREEASVPYYE